MPKFIIHKDMKTTIKEGDNTIQRYTQILTQKPLRVIFLSEPFFSLSDLSIRVFSKIPHRCITLLSQVFLQAWTIDTTHRGIVHPVRGPQLGDFLHYHHAYAWVTS